MVTLCAVGKGELLKELTRGSVGESLVRPHDVVEELPEKEVAVYLRHSPGQFADFIELLPVSALRPISPFGCAQGRLWPLASESGVVVPTGESRVSTGTMSPGW